MDERRSGDCLARVLLQARLDVQMGRRQFAVGDLQWRRKSAEDELLHVRAGHGIDQVGPMVVLALKVLPEVGDAEAAPATMQRLGKRARVAQVTLNDIRTLCGELLRSCGTRIPRERPHRVLGIGKKMADKPSALGAGGAGDKHKLTF